MLRVLTYHRIVDPATSPDLLPGLASAAPVEFARQVDFLARRYRPVSAAQVLDAKCRGVALPERAVLVTFDDAYRDFRTVAWPILRARAVPALLFVPTAFPDHPERRFWWDRLYRCVTRCQAAVAASPIGALPLRSPADRRRSWGRFAAHVQSLPHDEAMAFVDELCVCLGEATGGAENAGAAAAGQEPRGEVLGWQELRQLAREGVTPAPHSRWHPLLTRCSDGRIRDEVRGARADMQEALGEAPPVFSYPGGAHDARVRRILAQEGFELAVTQEDGANDLRTADPLRLRRTDITRRTTLPILRLRLQPWFGRVDRWRHRARLAAGDRGRPLLGTTGRPT